MLGISGLALIVVGLLVVVRVIATLDPIVGYVLIVSGALDMVMGLIVLPNMVSRKRNA
ncbi:MAG: hypothetical protein QM770_08350 [Tepidisphaeraceae bacterium]